VHYGDDGIGEMHWACGLNLGNRGDLFGHPNLSSSTVEVTGFPGLGASKLHLMTQSPFRLC